MFGALVGLGLASSALAAGPRDGSVPLICAVTSMFDCTREAGCERQVPDEGDELWRVDVEKRVVSNLDGSRSSPINTVEHKDGQLLLQGIQNGWAWSLVLYEETGRMSAGIADADGVIVLSGGCAAP
jgi:hypothetical protein